MTARQQHRRNTLPQGADDSRHGYSYRTGFKPTSLLLVALPSESTATTSPQQTTVTPTFSALADTNSVSTTLCPTATPNPSQHSLDGLSEAAVILAVSLGVICLVALSVVVHVHRCKQDTCWFCSRTVLCGLERENRSQEPPTFRTQDKIRSEYSHPAFDAPNTPSEPSFSVHESKYATVISPRQSYQSVSLAPSPERTSVVSITDSTTPMTLNRSSSSGNVREESSQGTDRVQSIVSNITIPTFLQLDTRRPLSVARFSYNSSSACLPSSKLSTGRVTPIPDVPRHRHQSLPASAMRKNTDPSLHSLRTNLSRTLTGSRRRSDRAQLVGVTQPNPINSQATALVRVESASHEEECFPWTSSPEGFPPVPPLPSWTNLSTNVPGQFVVTSEIASDPSYPTGESLKFPFLLSPPDLSFQSSMIRAPLTQQSTLAPPSLSHAFLDPSPTYRARRPLPSTPTQFANVDPPRSAMFSVHGHPTMMSRALPTRPMTIPEPPPGTS